MKNLTPFHHKTLNDLEIEDKFLKSVKGIFNEPTDNIVLYGERMKAFSKMRMCGRFSWGNEAKKNNVKVTQIRKKEGNIPLFVDSMILYTENSK